MYSCMNTIGDMQNEKYFYGHCNEFEYKHDFSRHHRYHLSEFYTIPFF